MSFIDRKISELESDMRDALRREDWNHLGALDDECRRIVLLINEADMMLRIDPLTRLSGVYRDIVDGCEAIRLTYAGDATSLTRSRSRERQYDAMARVGTPA